MAVLLPVGAKVVDMPEPSPFLLVKPGWQVRPRLAVPNGVYSPGHELTHAPSSKYRRAWQVIQRSPSQAKQKFVLGLQPMVEATLAVVAVVGVAAVLLEAVLAIVVVKAVLTRVVDVPDSTPIWVVEMGWQVRPRLAVPTAV